MCVDVLVSNEMIISYIPLKNGSSVIQHGFCASDGVFQRYRRYTATARDRCPSPFPHIIRSSCTVDL